MATTRMALAKEVVVVVVVGCKRMRESRPRIGKHLEDDDEEELGTFLFQKAIFNFLSYISCSFFFCFSFLGLIIWMSKGAGDS